MLLTEFKVDIAQYLKPLGNTPMRTLADLIQFNIDHCAEEMKYFGQEVFETGRGDVRRSHGPGLPRRA